jgi:hypothetical protein
MNEINQIESFTPTVYLSKNKLVEELPFFLDKLKYFIMSDSDYFGHIETFPKPDVYIYLTHKDSQGENVIAFRNDIKANKKWKLLGNHVPSGIYRPKILKQCLKGNEKNIQMVSLCLEDGERDTEIKEVENSLKMIKEIKEEVEEEDTISFEISIDDSFEDDK